MKIERIDEEIAKTKAKIKEFQKRLSDLERQKTELENSAIVELVRSVNIAPQELAAFINDYKQRNNVAELKDEVGGE